MPRERGDLILEGLGATDPAGLPAVEPTTSIANMTHVGNADRDGTINSDLAFWGDLAYAGSYSGFRILDISQDQPREIVDFPCNTPQGDVSVYEMGGRRLLFQSVDSPQTREDCESANTALVDGFRQPGFEGIRIFDVTEPAGLLVSAGHRRDAAGGRHRRPAAVLPAAQQDLDRHGPVRRAGRGHGQGAAAQHPHAVQQDRRFPGLPRHPGLPAARHRRRRVRGRGPDLGRLAPAEPDDDRRGRGPPHAHPGPDTWSSYWYNDRVYANDGLATIPRHNRTATPGPMSNRGLDVFTFQDGGATLTAKRWRYANPQTQEASQVP